jgi:hypothetical protein
MFCSNILLSGTSIDLELPTLSRGTSIDLELPLKTCVEYFVSRAHLSFRPELTRLKHRLTMFLRANMAWEIID